jgi:2-amino-4-hydroxy-6-hydroxymethyldihydropteridine diphosphokinase
MHTVYLALGSNVGNKKLNIDQAVIQLAPHVKNIRLSKLRETKPMYFEAQDVFLNAALRGQTDLAPSELLTFVKKLEAQIGRKVRFANGPREIDIDILFYDSQTYTDEFLTIPHTAIADRDFVLRPLMDIAPELIHPVLRKSITKLYDELNARKQT